MGLQPPHPCGQRERSKSIIVVVVVLFSCSNKKKQLITPVCPVMTMNLNWLKLGHLAFKPLTRPRGFVNRRPIFGASKRATAAPCRAIAARQAPGLFSLVLGKSTSLKIDADEVEQTTSPPSWSVFAYISLHKYHPVGLLMTSQQSRLRFLFFIFLSPSLPWWMKGRHCKKKNKERGESFILREGGTKLNHAEPTWICQVKRLYTSRNL